MPNGKTSRELHVLLSVWGHQNSDGKIEHLPDDPNSLQWNYSLISGVPSANPGAVASDGDLDLGSVGVGGAYGNEVDIYFRITGAIVGNNGFPYPVRFATATETSGNPQQVGFCWRINNEIEKVRIPWPANMVVTRPDNYTVKIDDQSPGNNPLPYIYCLGMAIDNIAGPGSYYYVTFDPKIVNG